MILLETMDSTNAYVKRAWRTLAPGEGVLSLRQTSGRGRLGRAWDSREGGVYLSVYLPTAPSLLPLRAALAVCDSLPAELNARVKWPNDIVLCVESSWKKLCGILCEGFEGGAVAGIGVNLRFSGPRPTTHSCCFADFAEPPRPEALGESIRQALLRRLEPDPAEILRSYEPRCVTLGRRVRLPDGREGDAIGLDREGRLLVRTGETVVPVGSGEVVVQSIY